MSPEPPPESVLVSLARIEGKLDLANQQLGDVHATLQDHETRLRRLQDDRPNYVTKAAARWWFTAVTGLIVAASGALAVLLRH